MALRRLWRTQTVIYKTKSLCTPLKKSLLCTTSWPDVGILAPSNRKYCSFDIEFPLGVQVLGPPIKGKYLLSLLALSSPILSWLVPQITELVSHSVPLVRADPLSAKTIPVWTQQKPNWSHHYVSSEGNCSEEEVMRSFFHINMKYLPFSLQNRKRIID